MIIGVEINDDFLSHRDVRTMEFWEVDFEKRLWLHPEDGGKAVRLTRGNWLSGRDEYSGLELILQSFPAGDYALAQVVWGDHGVSAMENQAIAFTVRPGEITYVGDVSFDTPMTILQDVEVRVIARNDALAEKLRAKYPNLRGNVRHQDLRVLHMNCNASGFWSNPLRECSFPPKAAS